MERRGGEEWRGVRRRADQQVSGRRDEEKETRDDEMERRVKLTGMDEKLLQRLSKKNGDGVREGAVKQQGPCKIK